MAKCRRHKGLTVLLLPTLIVLTAAVAYFLHRNLRNTPDRHADISGYAVNGIDISAHNGKVDFGKVKQSGVDFVIIKATEGITFKDSLFAANHRNATDKGLKTGAYHFFRFDADGIGQAHNFLSSVAEKNLSLPLIIDVESHTNPAVAFPAKVRRNLRDMVDELASFGFPVMIYTNKEGYEKFVAGEFDDCPLWICTFDRPENGLEWSVWQYSHRGNVAGLDSDVDLNVFEGDSLEWTEWTRDNESRILTSNRFLPAINQELPR